MGGKDASGSSAVVDQPRRVGRPRSQPESSNGLEPREEILKIAAELFIARGYAATTTRIIAERVGLRQASLFHYFDRKEEILAELLDRTVRPAIAFSDWVEGSTAAPGVVLHSLCWWDAHNLSSRPNLAGLQLLHEVRDERFKDFWENRELLRGRYRRAIHAVADRYGSGQPDELVTTIVFGLVESVLMWFDRSGAPNPTDVASAIARAALSISGVDAGLIDELATQSTMLRQQFSAELLEGAEPSP